MKKKLLISLFAILAIIVSCAEEDPTEETTGTSLLTPAKANCGDRSCM